MKRWGTYSLKCWAAMTIFGVTSLGVIDCIRSSDTSSPLQVNKHFMKPINKAKLCDLESIDFTRPSNHRGYPVLGPNCI